MDLNQKKKQNVGEIVNYPNIDPYQEPQKLDQLGGYGQDVEKQRLYELLQKKLLAEQSNPDTMAMKNQENMDAATLTDQGFKPGFEPQPGDFGYVAPKFQKLKSLVNGRQ